MRQSKYRKTKCVNSERSRCGPVSSCETGFLLVQFGGMTQKGLIGDR